MLTVALSFCFAVKSQSSTNILSRVPERRRRRDKAFELSGVLRRAFSGKEICKYFFKYNCGITNRE